MSGDDLSTQGISGAKEVQLRAQKAAQAQASGKFVARQVAAKQGFVTDVAFNPLSIMRRFQQLADKAGRREKLSEEQEIEEALEVNEIEELTKDYKKKNQELDPNRLRELLARLTRNDTKEEMLAKVLDAFADYTLADEALDFLIEASREEEIVTKLKEAKQTLNAEYRREIVGGRNITKTAQAYAAKGVDSPSALREIYRDITGNPRNAITLFEELSQKYPFQKMRFVIAFLLHSLGADLKAKGPSIESAELQRLVTDTRSLQAILGVYRFFRSRMRLIFNAFKYEDLPYPAKVTYETLARLFIKLLQDRYPSADKVLQLGHILGLSEEILAQIIIATQMRDAVRQIAPRLFKSEQHRQDVLSAFLDALQELEEEMEEKEEEEEKEENEE